MKSLSEWEKQPSATNTTPEEESQISRYLKVIYTIRNQKRFIWRFIENMLICPVAVSLILGIPYLEEPRVSGHLLLILGVSLIFTGISSGRILGLLVFDHQDKTPDPSGRVQFSRLQRYFVMLTWSGFYICNTSMFMLAEIADFAQDESDSVILGFNLIVFVITIIIARHMARGQLPFQLRDVQ